MRVFHSYGPVDCKIHFCAPRNHLIEKCTEQIIGLPEKGGSYFTIWAPRQTGKTWLMHQVVKEIEKKYEGRFIVGKMSMQRVIMNNEDPDHIFLKKIPRLLELCFNIKIPWPESWPESWDDWIDIFSFDRGIFDRPVILFVDEFDSLPTNILDKLVTLFRDMYLNRDTYCLHGLALIGVRAVLGVESLRGSPFNIQHSLKVPDFSRDEVKDLFSQFENESGQKIGSDVVEKVYNTTKGQPGLICWFGELLTEKYNPGNKKEINNLIWNNVFEAALYREWNNTLLNLIKKAKNRYTNVVMELFNKSDIPFNIRSEWCSYLYLNGVISEKEIIDIYGKKTVVCCFSSPFIQINLFNALTDEFVETRMPILALDPLDDLEDVFKEKNPNLPALLERYKAYLLRLKARGLNPWKNQPRRTDLHLTEWVGHFHLYAWLKEAVESYCIVSPEFPTGNGKVDLHLRCGEKQGIIEVKSFQKISKIKAARKQAAQYARSLGLDTVTIAMFTPVEDDTVLEKISGEEIIDSIKVIVSAIGWV